MRDKLANFVVIDQSVAFCFITIYTVFLILLLYLSNLNWFSNGNNYYMYLSARYLQVFAFTFVFIDVTKVLFALNVRGSKILLYLGRITEVIVGILVIIHYIAFYIPNSKFDKIIVKKIHDLNIMTLLTLYIISLFLAVLSVCFIFTNVQNFIDSKKLRMIKIGIFIFSLFVIAHCNTYYWTESKNFQYHLMKDLNNVKYFDENTKFNKKYEILNLAYMSLWNPLCCYVFFFMLYYLRSDMKVENATDASIESIAFVSFSI